MLELRLEERLEKVPRNWDLICLGGDDLLGTPDMDTCQHCLYQCPHNYL